MSVLTPNRPRNATHGGPKALANWLRHLQRQSWELELLIAGFSLLLLFNAPKGIHELGIRWTAQSTANFAPAFLFLMDLLGTTAYIMAFNLVLHVLVRGTWIGFVGLSSVFPKGIATKKMKFNAGYNKFNRQKNLKQTRIIVMLDNLASTMFAFNFLMAGYVISLLIHMVMSITILILSDRRLYDWHTDTTVAIAVTILILHMSAGALIVINFLTLDSLKKIPFVAWVFGLVDALYGRILLARLYRPIYYTLSTNTPRFLVPGVIYLYMGIVIFFSTQVVDQKTQFVPLAHNQIESDKYESMVKPNQELERVVIKSPYVEKDYIPIFVRFYNSEGSIIARYCQLEERPPYRNIMRVFGIGFNSSDGDPEIHRRKLRKYSDQVLTCLETFFTVEINGDPISGVTWFFEEHAHLGEKGFRGLVPIKELKPGRYILKVKRPAAKPTPEEPNFTVAELPFWKAD